MSATADRRSPAIARRRLSRELRRLRHEAGLTADKVRGDVDLSQGKMNRLETGIGPQPNISDIRVLLDYCKAGSRGSEASSAPTCRNSGRSSTRPHAMTGRPRPG